MSHELDGYIRMDSKAVHTQLAAWRELLESYQGDSLSGLARMTYKYALTDLGETPSMLKILDLYDDNEDMFSALATLHKEYCDNLSKSKGKGRGGTLSGTFNNSQWLMEQLTRLSSRRAGIVRLWDLDEGDMERQLLELRSEAFAEQAEGDDDNREIITTFCKAVANDKTRITDVGPNRQTLSLFTSRCQGPLAWVQATLESTEMELHGTDHESKLYDGKTALQWLEAADDVLKNCLSSPDDVISEGSESGQSYESSKPEDSHMQVQSDMLGPAASSSK